MRKAIVVAVAVAGVSLLAACERKPGESPKAPAPPGSGPAAQAPAPARPVSMPQRAPGLWEQKVTTAGMSQTTSICIDKAVEQRFSVWGQQAGKNDCTQSQVTPRIGGGWNFASTCNMGETGVTTTKGEVTGDFAKAYKVSAQNTIAGASTPQMNGTHQMTIEATWKGPCPAGVKPGDMLLPGGASKMTFHGPDGESFPNDGVYLEVAPGRKLVFTDAFTEGWRTTESPMFVGVITFEDAGNGETLYTARARHWTKESTQQHKDMGFEEGWGVCADQMEALAKTL